MQLARSPKPQESVSARAARRGRPRRGARTALTLPLVALLACGCPSDPPLRARDAVDSGDAWLGGPGTSSAEAPRKGAPNDIPMPKDDPLDLAALLPKLQSKALVEASAHGASGFSAEILVNELAAAYPSVGPSRALPEGALIIEALRRAPELAPEGYLVMRKRARGFFPSGGDWAYSAYDANRLPLERGANSLCARCHAEAPSDWLFGPPRR